MLKAYWLIYYTHTIILNTSKNQPSKQCQICQQINVVCFRIWWPNLTHTMCREEEYDKFKPTLQYIKCSCTLEYLTCIDGIYRVLSY